MNGAAESENFFTSEIKTLIRGSLLMVAGVFEASKRKYLDPAAAYEQAERELKQERLAQLQNNHAQTL